MSRGRFQKLAGDRRIFGVHRNRVRDVLRGEGLELLDGVVGRVDQEPFHQLYAFVVGKAGLGSVL